MDDDDNDDDSFPRVDISSIAFCLPEMLIWVIKTNGQWKFVLRSALRYGIEQHICRLDILKFLVNIGFH